MATAASMQALSLSAAPPMDAAPPAADGATAQHPASLPSLPGPALHQLLSSLPLDDRLRLRLTCRALAAAAADTFSGACADVSTFEAGGPAAAASLASAAPRAAHALVRLSGDAPSPAHGTLVALFSALLSSKPLLTDLNIQETTGGAWGAPPPLSRSPPGWLPALASACAAPLVSTTATAAVAAAAAAAAAAAGSMVVAPPRPLPAPALSRLELIVEDAPNADDLLCLLRALPALKALHIHMRSPHRPGVAPVGIREIAGAALEALTLPIDTTSAAAAWRAVCEGWHAGTLLVNTLTTLQLRCTGPGGLELPANWLLAFPRLSRLDCHGGISLALGEVWEAAAAAAASGAEVCTAPGGAAPGFLRAAAPAGAAAAAAAGGASSSSGVPPPVHLPPLASLGLDQEELDDAGWRALACGGLLGRNLTSLRVSRAPLPPPEDMPRLALGLGPGGLPPGTHGNLPSFSSGGSSGRAGRGSCSGGGRGAVRPFPELRELTVGVSDAAAALPAVAALPQLTEARLLHLRAGARGFAPGSAAALSPLTSLTKLVMLPVQPGGPGAAEWWEGDGRSGGACGACGTVAGCGGRVPAAGVSQCEILLGSFAALTAGGLCV